LPNLNNLEGAIVPRSPACSVLSSSDVHLELCRSHYFDHAAPSAVADGSVGKAGKMPTFVFIAPGDHGATVTGMHGMVSALPERRLWQRQP